LNLHVKLSVIALDYDGTIARDDTLHPEVRDAIANARGNGIVVLLVTGRILSDLQRVAGDLHFVDGVVAENGAVLHVPATGHTTNLAPPVPPLFVEELRRRGVPCAAGASLVDADASVAQQLLEVIRALELPLVLAFNASRVMTLPQGVSKATGLQAMLTRMRLSARNALAIGDAENDHEMLRLAEVGVAVEWGSPRLRAEADIVLPGASPVAIATFLRTLAGHGMLPVAPRSRRRLHLGYAEDGREFSLAVRGRNVLVAGDAKSGKSWVAGLLCEQLILLGYSVCVIDPEGDYRTLESLPGVTVLGGDDPPPTPRELLRALRYPDRSVVIDLSRQPHEQKVRYVRGLLPMLNAVRRRTGLPHRILIDEAHYFLHDGDALDLLDLDRNGYTILSYRASTLPQAVLDAAEVMIVTCESNPAEVAALQQRCLRCSDPTASEWARLPHLRPGEAVALPVTEEAQGRLQHFNIGTRLTPHVRHREKYVDVPVGADHAFVFMGHGRPSAHRVRTLRAFVNAIESTPAPALEPYLRRGDFSRWISDVFGDRTLAAELESVQRITASGGSLSDTLAQMVAAIRARYDVVDDDEVLVHGAATESSPTS
jgi:hydroxymethylpyrimidine pyrophosphatase-like HAD family hydrolase